MFRILSALLMAIGVAGFAAADDYRIADDYGGSIEQYNAKYAEILLRHDRVIIDGVCNSACTLVLGIVPLDRICVTPNASLGFHMPYYNLAATDGIKVLSYQGKAEFMMTYPQNLQDWLNRRGGLTSEIKTLANGPDLWEIVNPCPEPAR